MELISQFVPFNEIHSSVVDIADALPPVVDRSKILVNLSQQNLGFFEFRRKLRIGHLLHGPFTVSINSVESDNP